MSNLIVPTIIVHGGAGAYASMKYDHVSKQEIEAGKGIFLFCTILTPSNVTKQEV